MIRLMEAVMLLIVAMMEVSAFSLSSYQSRIVPHLVPVTHVGLHVNSVDVTIGWKRFRIKLARQDRSPIDSKVTVAHGQAFDMTRLVPVRKKSPSGWARLILMRESGSIQGAFMDPDNSIWHIRADKTAWLEPSDPPMDDMLVDHFLHIRAEDTNATTSPASAPRNILAQNVGNISGCPADTKTALLGVAADRQFLSQFDSGQDARLHLIDVVNKASEVWETAFNISLQINEIVLGNGTEDWDQDTCSGDADGMQQRLQALAKWRSDTGRGNDGMATWTLMTACPQGDIIGLSWESMVCQPNGVNVVHHTVLDYRVLAHEIGHSFGAVHDCDNVTCASSGDSTSCCPLSNTQCDASGRYIMNPASTDSQYAFSACSQGNICGGILGGQVNVSCLRLQSQVEDTGSDGMGWRRQQCTAFLGDPNANPCDFKRCQLSCIDSSSGKCLVAPQNFADGTPCDLSAPAQRVGQCIRGMCKPVGNYSGQPTLPIPSSKHSNSVSSLIWKLLVAVGTAIVAVVISYLAACWWIRRHRRTHPPLKPISDPIFVSSGSIAGLQIAGQTAYVYRPPRPPLPPPLILSSAPHADGIKLGLSLPVPQGSTQSLETPPPAYHPRTATKDPHGRHERESA